MDNYNDGMSKCVVMMSADGSLVPWSTTCTLARCVDTTHLNSKFAKVLRCSVFEGD